MSVQSVSLTHVDLQRADNSDRKYTAHYVVVTTDTQDHCETVRAALPALGSTITAGNDAISGAIVLSHSARLENFRDSMRTWSCELELGRADLPSQKPPEGDSPFPWDVFPEISGGGEQTQVEVGAEDYAGTAVKNSAGDPFDDLTKDFSIGTMQIKRAYPPGWPALLNFDVVTNAINSGVFFGRAADTWKCEPPQWVLKWFGDLAYVEATLTFRYDSRTWLSKPLDRGPRDSDGVGPRDALSTRFNGNAPLDGAGAFLAIGDDPVYFDGVGGNPAPFRFYSRIDFPAILDLPSEI